MKKKYYLSIPLFLILLLFTLNHNAQGLNEITGMRIYEHHSAIINGGNGGSANGTQSGYDFVNHTYYNSFDPNSFGPYTMGEEMNIDLVEHNGPYSSNASTSFGFTSGVSSIWAGDITGNGITLWVKAPTSFNYGMLNNASVMESTYNSGTPSISVESVSENDVYIGRIRNTNDYVAMRCYNVTATTEDVYFDFDYKYDGGCNTTGVDIQLACGSFTWIDGNTYTNSNNTATHTLTSSQGCDSVVTLNLTINSTINTTDTQVACGSYTWTDGNTYTASNNTATQTLTSIQGCDSVVTLNLTINEYPSNSVSLNGLTMTSGEISSSDVSFQWIDCNNNAPISNETEQSYVAVENGNYAVIVNNSQCIDTSECVEINTVSVEALYKEQLITFYPNPIKENFTIRFNKTSSGIIRVYDILGEQVLSEVFTNVSSCNVALNLPSGNYFVKVKTNDQNAIMQFIKK